MFEISMLAKQFPYANASNLHILTTKVMNIFILSMNVGVMSNLWEISNVKPCQDDRPDVATVMVWHLRKNIIILLVSIQH